MPSERSWSKGENESAQILSALGAVVRTRRTLLLLCALGVLIPVLIYNETATPVYEASTSLVFEEVSSPVTDDLTQKTSRELQMFNRIEEMNSAAFSLDLAKALPDSLKSMFPKPRNAPKNLDVTQHIAEAIHESFAVFPLRSSNVVRVRARTHDPRLSVAVANLAPTVLEARNYRIRQEGGTDLRQFVETQLSDAETRLKKSEDNLTRFKNQKGISSLEGESAETLRRLTDAEVLYNTTSADRSAAEQKLRSVRESITSQRGRMAPSITNRTSASTQGVRDRLVSLEAEYAQLSVEGTSTTHPRMVELRYEIGQAKRGLSDEAMRLARSGSTGDPITNIDQYTQQSVALQLEVESLRAREEALRRTMGKYRGSLSHLPAIEAELARLTRERDVNHKIYTSLLENREGIRVSQAMQIPNHRVVDWAQLPEEPILPRKLLNLGLGLTLGLMLGLGTGLFLESGKTSLRSMVMFEDQTGLPVLARVPATKGGASPRPWTRMWRRGPPVPDKGDPQRALVSHLDPASAAGEAYFMLRTRLEILGMGSKYRSLLVTSTGPRDGKSSTLCNLAATFGAAGQAALVIDAELRRPVIHRYLGVNQWPGVSDLLVAGQQDGTPLAAESPPSKPRLTIPRENGELFQTTKVDGVTVLASGRRVRDTEWETARPQLGALLEELKNDYDVLLVDSAPPILVHDTLALCSLVDAVIVVVNQKTYDSARFLETKRLLERAGANILGAVINKVETYGTYSYYYDQRYSPREAGDTPVTSRT
jgi:succinoglycan biosynthesis transport protein ExoP